MVCTFNARTLWWNSAAFSPWWTPVRTTRTPRFLTGSLRTLLSAHRLHIQAAAAEFQSLDKWDFARDVRLLRTARTRGSSGPSASAPEISPGLCSAVAGGTNSVWHALPTHSEQRLKRCLPS